MVVGFAVGVTESETHNDMETMRNQRAVKKAPDPFFFAGQIGFDDISLGRS